MRPQTLGNSSVVALSPAILQMRRKQTESPLENFRRARGALARQNGSGNSALRCPTGMQELGLRSIHPALQQTGGKAPANPRRLRHLSRIEPQQFGRKVSDAESSEQAGRM